MNKKQISSLRLGALLRVKAPIVIWDETETTLEHIIYDGNLLVVDAYRSIYDLQCIQVISSNVVGAMWFEELYQTSLEAPGSGPKVSTFLKTKNLEVSPKMKKSH
jgi:hypothetical protein